ncbi:hypothetical protein HDZ31DRAFT_62871 [Schizophyllum fasciatum]
MSAPPPPNPPTDITKQLADSAPHFASPLPSVSATQGPSTPGLATDATNEPTSDPVPRPSTPKRFRFAAAKQVVNLKAHIQAPFRKRTISSTSTLVEYSHNDLFGLPLESDGSSSDDSTSKSSAENLGLSYTPASEQVLVTPSLEEALVDEIKRFKLSDDKRHKSSWSIDKGHKSSHSQDDTAPERHSDKAKKQLSEDERWQPKRKHHPPLGDYVPQALKYQILVREWRVPNPGVYPLNYNVATLMAQHQAEVLYRRLSGTLTMFPCRIAPRTVLELGCGEGWWAMEAAKTWSDAQIVALDVANVHKEELEHIENIKTVCCNFMTHTLPFADDTFDFVRLAGAQLSLKAHEDWEFLTGEVMRVLRVGGRFELTLDDTIFAYGGRLAEGTALPKWLAESSLKAPVRAKTKPATSVIAPHNRPLSRIIEAEEEEVQTLMQLLAQPGQPWPDNKTASATPSVGDAQPAAPHTPITPSTPGASQWRDPRYSLLSPKRIPGMSKVVGKPQPVHLIDPQSREELTVTGSEADAAAGDVSEPQEYVVQTSPSLPRWLAPKPKLDSSASLPEPVLDITRNAWLVRPGLQAGLTPADRAPAGPGCVSVPVEWLENAAASMSLENTFREMCANKDIPSQAHVVARKALVHIFGGASTHEMSPYEVMLAPPDAALAIKKGKRESKQEISEDEEPFFEPAGVATSSASAPEPAPVPAPEPATSTSSTPVIVRPPRLSSLPRRRSSASCRRSASSDTLRADSALEDDDKGDDDDMDFGCSGAHSVALPERPAPGLLVWPSRYIPMSPLEVEYHACAGPSNVFAAREPLQRYAATVGATTDEVEELLAGYEEFRRARFFWRTSVDASASRTTKLADVKKMDHPHGYDLTCAFDKRELPYERDSLVHIRTVRPFLAIKTGPGA